MRAFTSHLYTVDIGHHSYPMEKYRLVPQRLLTEEILLLEEFLEPEAATLDDVLRVHTPGYVHALVNGTLERKAMLRIGLPWSPALVRRAFAVIGGTIGAARLALEEGVAANLAGGTHHAFADHGEGYCIFNDMVIAMRRLRAEGVAQRFLVVDLDVHQGNGTAALCQHDDEVFTFSIHGESNYPVRKQQSSWDIALLDGTTDEPYLQVLAEALPRILDRFIPDLIFFQAGVDVLAEDRLGKFSLTMEGLEQRDRFVRDFARRAGLPLIITLGGGYAKDVHRIVAAHCQTIEVVQEG